MKEILLNHGLVALVDDEDYEKLSKFTWRIKKGRKTTYAQTHNGTQMHRMIVGAQKGQITDHKDHNGLNNQKSNLRLTDNYGNQRNITIKKNNKTGFKGVIVAKRPYNLKNIYIARIRTEESRRKHLGYFSTPEEAARAYDEAAKKYHGEFACLNFVDKRIENAL